MFQRNLKAIAGVLVSLTLVLCSFRVGAQSPPDEKSPTVDDLLVRISDLEDRLDQLEAKLERQPVLHYTAPQVIPNATEDVLRRYRRGEMNGIPYHVIPIEGQADTVQSQSRQLPQSVQGGEPHRVQGGE